MGYGSFGSAFSYGGAGYLGCLTLLIGCVIIISILYAVI